MVKINKIVMMKCFFVLIILLVFLFSTVATAQHLNKKKDYQVAWCTRVGGTTEYVLDDKTRVDCLTDEYTIEFDFAPKWAKAT